MPETPSTVENISTDLNPSTQGQTFSGLSENGQFKATEFSSSIPEQLELEEKTLEHRVDTDMLTPQSSSEVARATVEVYESNIAPSELPSYVDSSEEDYDPESIEKHDHDNVERAVISKSVVADSDVSADVSNNDSTASVAVSVSVNADVSVTSANPDVSANPNVSIAESGNLNSSGVSFSSAFLNDTTQPTQQIENSESNSPSVHKDSQDSLHKPSLQEQDEDEDEDEGYDPEVTIAPVSTETTETSAIKSNISQHTQEQPSSELLAAEKLKEAYEAVMQSDLVKLDAFSKLSQEDQMAAIQALLQEKNVALPTINPISTSSASANYATPISATTPFSASTTSLVTRPDLTQPMSAEERQAFEKYLSEEQENSNWETLDKLPSGLRLFIGNLFNNPTLKEELFRILNFYGEVVQITIKTGYGFAQFRTADQAQKCVDGERDIPFQGRLLRFNVSYGHKNPHGQVRGRDRMDEGGNDQKRLRNEGADVQIFVTDGSDDSLGKLFRNSLRSANLSYTAKTLDSTETSEEMVEAAYMGSIGACVVNGSKIDLQVFQESTDGGVKFDEYLGIDPATVCDLLDKAKQQKLSKQREQGRNDYTQRPYNNNNNDGGRQPGAFRPNSYNYNGRGNMRNKQYGNQTWHRGQEGGVPNQNGNNWQQRSNWKQNQQGYKPYYNSTNDRNGYNQGGGSGYINANSFGPSQNNRYSNFPSNNGPQDMNNYSNNGYGQYQQSNWRNQMNTPPHVHGFNSPAPGGSFPYANSSMPQGMSPQGPNPMSGGGYSNPNGSGQNESNSGFHGYSGSGPSSMAGPPMTFSYGQPPASGQPPVPETGSALMDMLAKLGRK